MSSPSPNAGPSPSPSPSPGPSAEPDGPAGRRLAIAGILADQRPLPRYLCILIDGLARAGVEIDLLLPQGGPGGDLGIETRVGCYPLDGEDEGRALLELRRYLALRRPCAILTNRDRAAALIARVPRAERPFAVPRIGTDVDQKLKGKHLLKRWWAKRGLASTFAAADTLIGVSDGVCAALERLLRGRRAPPIRRIYNPIDLEAFARLAREPAAHPWLQAKETPVILSVGRLVRAKDYPTLIRAFALVRKRQECRLIVLGEGRQRPRLESLIRRLGLADSVDLPGFAPNPFAYMARADLLALSSIFEGNPNVLVEAMAVGTPCVATDCRSGPRETLAGGRYGPLVPTGDARALAQALLATLAHPPEPALLAEAIGRFDRDRAVAAYLHALNLAPPEPGAAP